MPVERRGAKRMGLALCQASRRGSTAAASISATGRSADSQPRMRRRRNSGRKPVACTTRMTTAEATVAAPCSPTASTRSTRCRASTTTSCSTRCSSAGDRMRTVHTRHEQGAAYMALGAALATGRPQAYAVVPGPGPAQYRRGAAHRLWHERAGAGADRPDPAGRHRPRPRPSARDPRPGRHHLRGWSTSPRASARRTRRRAWSPRPCGPCAPAGPGRPRSNARSMSGAAAGRWRRSAAARRCRSRRSTTTPCSPPPSSSAPPSVR